jgi:hypothetical protein
VPPRVEAEPSMPSAQARMTPEAVIDDLIRTGNGLVLGRTLLDLWPQEHDESAFVIDALQFHGPPTNEKDRRTVEAFLRWQRRTKVSRRSQIVPRNAFELICLCERHEDGPFLSSICPCDWEMWVTHPRSASRLSRLAEDWRGPCQNPTILRHVRCRDKSRLALF